MSALRAVDPSRARTFGQATRRAPLEPLLTLDEVKVRLHLPSRWSVYRLIEHHGLPVRIVGRVYRVDADELDAWTKGERTTGGIRR